MRTKSILVLAILFISASSALAMINWDILDETYGNGTGQVSFVGSHVPLGGTFSEVLYDGHAILTSGPDVAYIGKTSLPGIPTDDSDITIEFKVADVTNNGLAIYLSQTNDIATTLWQHMPYLNHYDAGPDTIIEPAGNDMTNLAPAGFDGSAVHTYRFVRQNHHSYFYLFDNETPFFLCEMGSEIGWSLSYFEFGTPSGLYHTTDVYHLKMATGAYVPEPTTLLLLGLGAVLLRRKSS
ncbi:MAG: PEP-CTERM sorting domain-containing protein [Planctomycetota bacterium]